MPKDLHEKCKQQSWTKIEIKDGLPEGKGVFATRNIKNHTYICNYGGSFYNRKHCEKYLLPYEEKCNYLVEMRENVEGKWQLVYINHDNKCKETFGKFLNHSRIHPNVKCRIFAVSNGPTQYLDILFITLRDIKKNEELVWNYGPNFTGVNRCVKSCTQCKK